MTSGPNVLSVTCRGNGKDRTLPPLAKVLDLFLDIAAEGTYGTRAEWLYEFERTQATNEPAILFADAVKLGLLIEEIPGTFCLITPEPPVEEVRVTQPVISYFKAPIVQPAGEVAVPNSNVTLFEAWRAIVGTDHQIITDKARKLHQEYLLSGNKKSYGDHKRYKCDYFTFCATFHTKENIGIDQYAHLLALDFDKLTDKERGRLWRDLPNDAFFETALMYHTPGGIRWVIERPNHPTAEEFKSLQNYCLLTYGCKPDDTPDVSRASFIFQDQTAYLNPKYEN